MKVWRRSRLRARGQKNLKGKWMLCYTHVDAYYSKPAVFCVDVVFTACSRVTTESRGRSHCSKPVLCSRMKLSHWIRTVYGYMAPFDSVRCLSSCSSHNVGTILKLHRWSHLTPLTKQDVSWWSFTHRNYSQDGIKTKKKMDENITYKKSVWNCSKTLEKRTTNLYFKWKCGCWT